jgi:hypothetical protein
MNSGVSNAAMPLKLAISLNAPFIVPSADAPLSPMMYVDERVVETPRLMAASITRPT